MYMPDPNGPAHANAAAPTIFEAIVRKRALAATYNGGSVTLAPHIIFTRHGELFVDAVTLDRDGRPPREVKIGTFKVSGLGGLRLTPRSFDANPLFDPAAEKYAGAALMAVEP